MSYSPIDAALYVTFSSIAHPDSCLACITEKRKLDSLEEDRMIKRNILSITQSSPTLAQYTAIIYAFSKQLYVSFLNTTIPAAAMTTQVLSRNIQSDMMGDLVKTQLGFIHKMQEKIDYIAQTKAADPFFAIPSIKHKTNLVRTIFADSKPDLTLQEYEHLMEAVEKTQDYKNRFTYVNSLLIPK